MTGTPTGTTAGVPRTHLRSILLGALGVIVAPLAIVLATNSWSSPGPEEHVRMALGAVVAACVSVVGAWWLAFDRRSAGAPSATWFWGVACLITLGAVSTLQSVADRLTALITG